MTIFVCRNQFIFFWKQILRESIINGLLALLANRRFNDAERVNDAKRQWGRSPERVQRKVFRVWECQTLTGLGGEARPTWGRGARFVQWALDVGLELLVLLTPSNLRFLSREKDRRKSLIILQQIPYPILTQHTTFKVLRQFAGFVGFKVLAPLGRGVVGL